MFADILVHIIRFFLLAFVQVLVLNKIEVGEPFNGYFNPYLYILFLLMLPVNINKILLLVLSFLTGLTIDMFGSTAGMHASACLFIGFIRPSFLNLIAPREGYEVTLRLNIQGMGAATFLLYAAVLTLIHHTVLFMIEAFSFLHFGDLLLRIFSNGASTLLLVILSQVLTRRNREETI